MSSPGVLAAIACPFFGTLGFIIWDIQWEKGGGSGFSLNLFKCNLASLIFLCTVIYQFHSRSSTGIEIYTTEIVLALMVSSSLGIIIGDTLWLDSLRILGARRVIIMDSLKPFLGAALGRLFLQEETNKSFIFAISITVIGILIVSFESEDRKETIQNDRNNKNHDESIITKSATTTTSYGSIEDEENYSQHDRISGESNRNDKLRQEELLKGWIFAALNVIFDSCGNVITKTFAIHLSSFEVNLVRFGFAGLVLVFVSIFMRLTDSNSNRLNDSSITPLWYRLPDLTVLSWLRVSFGVLLVTFLSPSLYIYGLFRIKLGVALTLGALSPLFAVPMEWLLKGYKPTYRAFVGAILSIIGVVILSLGSSPP